MFQEQFDAFLIKEQAVQREVLEKAIEVCIFIGRTSQCSSSTLVYCVLLVGVQTTENLQKYDHVGGIWKEIWLQDPEYNYSTWVLAGHTSVTRLE
jgi:hypothetical protein